MIMGAFYLFSCWGYLVEKMQMRKCPFYVFVYLSQNPIVFEVCIPFAVSVLAQGLK